jgi:opacity protein-like surface antigen
VTKAKLLMVVLFLFVLLTGKTQAETYIEGYIGGSFPGNAANTLAPWHNRAFYFNPGNAPGPLSPGFIGGVKLGHWFARNPYVGLYVDVSYQRLDIAERSANGKAFNELFTKNGATPFPYFFKSKGEAVTLAFMFAVRYGFFPDQEVPFGRLQPYVAIGPVAMFTSQEPTFMANAAANPNLPPADFMVKPGKDSYADIGLAVEAGARWMILRNVSLDFSFKYRHDRPTYNYTLRGNFFNSLHCMNFFPVYNLFIFSVGVAYHF